jgi:hypothetical protein
MIAEPKHEAHRDDTVRGKRERKLHEKALDEALKNLPGVRSSQSNSRCCPPRASSHRVPCSQPRRKSSRALPVHHEGDPRVLLRVEAQRVRRPTPPAKRHRHVGSVGGFGDGETGAAAPFRRIYEHSATTMRHQTHHCERSRQRRADGRRLEINHRMERGPAPGEPGRLSGYVGGADYFPRGLVALLHRKNLSDANLRDPHWLFSFLRSSLPAGIRR